MPVIMRYLPAYGLAVYNAGSIASPELGPMSNPAAHPSVVKFHSGLKYPALATQFDASVTLPAQGNQTGAVLTGTYVRGVATLGAHGQADVPIIKAMLLNFNGANRPLQGSFPVQTTGNMCRVVDVGVSGSNVVLVYRGFTQAGSPSFVYPSISLTVRVFVFSWTISGNPTLEDPTLPMLRLTSSKIQVGRGQFDTDREYIRSDTGSENTLLTNGETWVVKGSNTATTFPQWGWRYSVDSTTTEGQNGSSSATASFKRIQLAT
jgi:hypothetical protein